MQQHALTEGLLVAMEEWAAKQPAALPDALEALEHLRAAGSERLVLGAAAAPSQRQEEPVLQASESADLTSDTLAPTALWSPTSRRTGAA